jgi:glycosyltransferase A (GT-A) superfamily protein (DUF2064 family)
MTAATSDRAAAADAALFAGIEWGTARVMAETRLRLQSLTLSWRELPTLWDVDTPEDLERLRRENLLRGLTGRPAG